MMKTKATQLYLSRIKPVSDKIPYFREFAGMMWRFLWWVNLSIKSIYDSIDYKKIYWIAPKRIKLGLSRELLSSEKAGRKTFKENFRIRHSNRYIVNFEDKVVYQSFYEHFTKGKPWNKTELYQRTKNILLKKNIVWRCSSMEDYHNRFKKLDKLYDEIKRNGVKTQKELNKETLLRENMIKEVKNEIIIYIGSDGELIHRNGQHRLSIAKLLNLDEVPVQILHRHKNWLKFRKEISTYINKQLNGKALQPLLHPDLTHIPSIWSDKRFELIKGKMNVKKGTLLDMNAHWGYFCHKFEDLGFQCTAMEKSKSNLYFMKKLKQAERLNFNIVEQSIFNGKENNVSKEGLNVDILLALNLFYQANSTIGDLNFKLKRILSMIKAKEIYFQIPQQEGGVLKLYKNDGCNREGLVSKTLVDFVMNNSSYKNVEKIGEERNHEIFKIW